MNKITFGLNSKGLLSIFIDNKTFEKVLNDIEGEETDLGLEHNSIPVGAFIDLINGRTPELVLSAYSDEPHSSFGDVRCELVIDEENKKISFMGLHTVFSPDAPVKSEDFTFDFDQFDNDLTGLAHAYNMYRIDQIKKDA